MSGDRIHVGDISDSTGIAIGSHARATVSQGVTGDQLSALFKPLYEQISRRPDSPDIDREELMDTLQKVEQEASSGEQANAGKIGRWLRGLLNAAPEIVGATATALSNPTAGVSAAVRAVAQVILGEAPGG